MEDKKTLDECRNVIGSDAILACEIYHLSREGEGFAVYDEFYKLRRVLDRAEFDESKKHLKDMGVLEEGWHSEKSPNGARWFKYVYSLSAEGEELFREIYEKEWKPRRDEILQPLLEA